MFVIGLSDLYKNTFLSIIEIDFFCVEMRRGINFEVVGPLIPGISEAWRGLERDGRTHDTFQYPYTYVTMQHVLFFTCYHLLLAET